MLRLLVGVFGKRVVRRQTASGGALDIKLGFAMLMDRRVPARSKLFALGLGAAIVASLLAAEFPLEALWGVMLPALGVGMDAMIDGLEAVIGPIVLASALLPCLAPKPVVDKLRDERDPNVVETHFVGS